MAAETRTLPALAQRPTLPLWCAVAPAMCGRWFDRPGQADRLKASGTGDRLRAWTIERLTSLRWEVAG